MKEEKILLKEKVFNNLPPIWGKSLIEEIKTVHNRSGRRLVIVDDDPTGTQTVHGVRLLTEWSIESLEKELKQSNVFFILSNSRSLSEEVAKAVNKKIGQNLNIAAKRTNQDFFVLSRSDSTLRGHFPAEVDALCEGIGFQPDATIMAPYFEAGGRYTIKNIHYVQSGYDLIPASMTEFAKDKSFPYRSSYLPEYVEEKTDGRIKTNRVFSISIETIRLKGPQGVQKELLSFPDGGVIVINAVHDRDLEVAVKGLLMAQNSGKRYIYRTAASFVRVLAGISEKPLLNAENMHINTTSGGILLVGSHVKKSTEQLERALLLPDITELELDVNKILNTKKYPKEIKRYSEMINTILTKGKDVIAYTSRKLITGDNTLASLAINGKISNGIVRLIQNLSIQPRFLIVKGGITANDVATKGLGVKSALIAGQLQPGIPVWILGDEAKFPNMHYVVYPGNVGTINGLADAMQSLR